MKATRRNSPISTNRAEPRCLTPGLTLKSITRTISPAVSYSPNASSSSLNSFSVDDGEAEGLREQFVTA